MADTLFDLNLFNDQTKTNYDEVECDRCHKKTEGYYILSQLTKTLYAKCKNCGKHAITYKPGLYLPWKPSKTFIKSIGKNESFRIAKELEENKGILLSRKDINIGGNVLIPDNITTVLPKRKLYCDAGTRNNGQKHKQDTIVVVCDSKKNILFEEKIGDFSNNEGEIVGLITCMKKFIDNQPTEIFSDSQIACNWVIKGWTIEHERRLIKGKLTLRHKEFIKKAHDLYVDTKPIITWIPRVENLAGHYIENTFGL